MSLTSIVIPVREEGETFVPYLEAVLSSVRDPKEVLVIHDTPEDVTVAVANRYREEGHPVIPLLNTYGPGPAYAIRYGLEHASGDAVVVTMADGSDDATQIDQMADLTRSGYVIVAASRYMKGGKQLGGPVVKRAMSRLAGVSLGTLAAVGTKDATSSFKAYDPEFVREAGVESTEGFEVAIELVAKAKRAGLPVTEIPTTWRDRTEGISNFKVARWVPNYLRWYLHALRPRAQSHIDQRA